MSLASSHFPILDAISPATSAALRDEIRDLEGCVSHCIDELEGIVVDQTGLAAPRARCLLDSRCLTKCRDAQKALRRHKQKLQESRSAVDTYDRCATKITSEMKSSRTKKDAACRSDDWLQTAGMLEAVDSSLRRLCRKLAARRDEFDPDRNGSEQEDGGGSEESLKGAVQSTVAEWIVLKELELELGAEVQKLVLPHPDEAGPAPSELKILSYTLEQLVLAHEGELGSVEERRAVAQRALQASTASCEALLNDIDKLELACSTVKAATEEAKTRQQRAFHQATEELLSQFRLQKLADRKEVDEVAEAVRQRQAEMAEYEGGVVRRYMAHPLHEEIHRLTHDQVKPTLGLLLATLSGGSTQANVDVRRRGQPSIDDPMVPASCISHPAVRNMLQLKGRPSGAEDVAEDEFDILVVRDTKNGNAIRLLQPMMSASHRKRRLGQLAADDDIVDARSSHHSNHPERLSPFFDISVAPPSVAPPSVAPPPSGAPAGGRGTAQFIVKPSVGDSPGFGVTVRC